MRFIVGLSLIFLNLTLCAMELIDTDDKRFQLITAKSCDFLPI